MGIVIISLVFVYTGNLIADILYRVIDPRIKGGTTSIMSELEIYL